MSGQSKFRKLAPFLTVYAIILIGVSLFVSRGIYDAINEKPESQSDRNEEANRMREESERRLREEAANIEKQRHRANTQEKP